MVKKGLLIGGPVWGEDYADIFERYCLASMRSPANLAALQANNATLEIYTDEATRPRMERMVTGLPTDINLIHFRAAHSKYDTLSVVHAQQVADCAATGRPFHMLVGDQTYSENYFPNLFRLADKHGNIMHSGVNCTLRGAGAKLNPMRNADGSLSVSAKELGRITWEHRHNRLSQFLMNDGEWPGFHMHIWRARDRAVIFCPHNSPVYLLPETGRNLGDTVSTLDSMAHLLGDYYAPTLDDDMTLSGIEADDGIGEYPRVGWEDFAGRAWEQAKSIKDLRRYYMQPSAEVPIPVDGRAPTPEDVLVRQVAITNRLIDYVAEKGWAANG
jgi:hypothetical protein